MLARWRAQVRDLPSAKHLDTPTLNDHMPLVLAELVAALRHPSRETIAEALVEGSPPAHGLQRVKDAFDVEEVVAEYNILRGCIHDLAERDGLTLRGQAFHILNRVLDGAIGLAVRSFAEEKALEVRRRREEYLAFVAHDLRTPLNAISLATQVLEMTHGGAQTGSPESAQMLRSLGRNIQRLKSLVAKVLEENTHLEGEVGVELQRRDFDLWPLVAGLFQDLAPVAGASGTRLRNEVPDDCVVYADAEVLRRVLQNLIANAIDHSPGAEVTIEARPVDENGTVECIVRDNGSGIPAERLQVIFDKYESEGGKEGSGLGLAIVRTFVEAHGGVVTAESELGVGSVFRFTLPARQA